MPGNLTADEKKTEGNWIPWIERVGNEVILKKMETNQKIIKWWMRVSTGSKEAPSYVRTYLLKLVLPLSRRTAWHVHIRAFLQFLQIKVFVNCPLKIKETGKPRVSSWQLWRSLCYCKRFVVLWRCSLVAFRNLHTARRDVASETVAPLVITQIYYILYSRLFFPFPDCPHLSLKKTIC